MRVPMRMDTGERSALSVQLQGDPDEAHPVRTACTVHGRDDPGTHDRLRGQVRTGGDWREILDFVTQVPESQTDALMLAGLGVMGGAARRKSLRA